MMETAPDPSPAMTAAVLTCLGRCYRMENKLALAEDVLVRGLELNRRAFGEMHPQLAYVMERLGEIYALRNQFTLARDYSSRAIAVMKASCGENSAAVAAALVNRANIEQHANALNAAAENFAAALKIVQSTPEMHAQNVVLESQILERYAVVLKSIHRDREAKDISALAKSFRAEFR
jgi:tetratricopeptide (TPR) repeat protein